MSKVFSGFRQIIKYFSIFFLFKNRGNNSVVLLEILHGLKEKISVAFNKGLKALDVYFVTKLGILRNHLSYL